MARTSEASNKLSTLQLLVNAQYTPVAPSTSLALDPEDIEDIGYSGALNRLLEIQWGSKRDGLNVIGRLSELVCTVNLIESVIPVAEDLGLVCLWIDAFLLAVAGTAISPESDRRSMDAEAEPSSTLADSSASTSLAVSSGDPHKSLEGSAVSCKPQVVSGLSNLVHKVQSKLPFRKLTQHEAAEQSQRDTEKYKGRVQEVRAIEALRKGKEKEMKQKFERERKQWYRFRLRQTEKHVIEISDSDSDGECEFADESDPDRYYDIKVTNAIKSHRKPPKQAKSAVKSSSSHVALPQPLTSTTQPATAAPTAAPTAEDPNKTKKPRTNWQLHWFWQDIVEAQETVGWSPDAITKYLHEKNPKWYAGKGGLYRGTVSRWIEHDPTTGEGRWTEATLMRVANGGRVGATKKSKALAAYPEITEGAAVQLRAMRQLGLTVHRPIAAAVIRAHIMFRAPQLLAPESKFKMSDTWVHSFIQDVLGWSMRQGTRATRKVPPNAVALCTKTFFRIMFAMRLHNIHPDFVINSDQGGVVLIPTGKSTYDVKGIKNVGVFSHEEKRQTTIVLASSMSGNILPFQSVWGGSTNSSLPAKDAPRRAEADTLGFTYAHGDTRHWSSRQTTKEWINDILDKYLARMRSKHGLPDSAKAILLIDVWPVHIADSNPDDFLPWMRRTHPNIIIIFVPGGCTGIFQPADVGLQRILKHIMKRAAQDFFVAIAMRKLAAGTPPDEVLLPRDLATLRNASVSWLIDAYRVFEANPQIIQKSWANCKADCWNLSPESLRSEEAWPTFTATTTADPEFAAEFARFDYSAVTGSVADESNTNGFDPALEHDDDLRLEPTEIARLCLERSSQANDPESSNDDDFLLDAAEVDSDLVPAPPSLPTAMAPSVQAHKIIEPAESSLNSDQPGIEQSTTTEDHLVQPADVYRLDVSVAGGIHYAATIDEAALSVTNARGKKGPQTATPRSQKRKRTQAEGSNTAKKPRTRRK
ncbi:hypothetical protein EIP86_011000 [Pleurotus ostreatoroseus]|nr:hypothetical protein EIP86_011000 [Pleurotus ostreatoroseus]